MLVIRCYLQRAFSPDYAVQVGIDRPHDRRRESVAVEVFDIAYGEVHCSFVDLSWLRLDVDEHIGLLIRPVERQVGEQSAVAYRRVVSLVGLRGEVIHEQRLGFGDHITVRIAEDASVIGREHLLHNIGGIAFDAGECKQVDQSHLFAVGCLLAELCYEFRGQCLLKQTYIVDVTFQSVRQPYGSACQRADACCGEHEQQLVVDIERTGVVCLTDD